MTRVNGTVYVSAATVDGEVPGDGDYIAFLHEADLTGDPD